MDSDSNYFRKLDQKSTGSDSTYPKVVLVGTVEAWTCPCFHVNGINVPRCNNCGAPKLVSDVAAIDWDSLVNFDEAMGSTFKATGLSACTCTSFTAELAILFPGRVQAFGFAEEDNPGSRLAQEVGGHDFAVIDGRFIVDPWITEVCSSADTGTQIVFDLQNPNHFSEIIRLYGDRFKWERLHEYEARNFPKAAEVSRPGASVKRVGVFLDEEETASLVWWADPLLSDDEAISDAITNIPGVLLAMHQLTDVRVL